MVSLLLQFCAGMHGIDDPLCCLPCTPLHYVPAWRQQRRHTLSAPHLRRTNVTPPTSWLPGGTVSVMRCSGTLAPAISTSHSSSSQSLKSVSQAEPLSSWMVPSGRMFSVGRRQSREPGEGTTHSVSLSGYLQESLASSRMSCMRKLLLLYKLLATLAAVSTPKP